jgi:hypothetical protein
MPKLYFELFLTRIDLLLPESTVDVCWEVLPVIVSLLPLRDLIFQS